MNDTVIHQEPSESEIIARMRQHTAALHDLHNKLLLYGNDPHDVFLAIVDMDIAIDDYERCIKEEEQRHE